MQRILKSSHKEAWAILKFPTRDESHLKRPSESSVVEGKVKYI